MQLRTKLLICAKGKLKLKKGGIVYLALIMFDLFTTTIKELQKL